MAAALLLLVGSFLAAASLWLRVDLRSERPRPADGFGVGRALGAQLRGTQGSAFVREGAKDAAFVFGSRHQRRLASAGCCK